MELVAGLDTQIFVIFLGVVVALGCTLIAFLVDYLKGKNERLREQVLEMTVRQEERARHPQAQLDSTAVLTAIAQVGKNLELVVRAAVNQGSPVSQEAAEAPVHSEPVFQKRPAAKVQPEAKPVMPESKVETVTKETLVATEETTTMAHPAAVAAALSAEPDWHKATWHEAPAVEVAEPTETTKPIGESLRSLFDAPSSAAEAARLELERRLDETIPEELLSSPAPTAEEPAALAETPEEPVVRIRVLNNGVASPLSEPAPAPAPEVLQVAPEVEEPVVAEETLVEAVQETVYEELPVTAPVDFLTAADLGDSVVSEPIESFDSLMAAVNAEPSVAPETELVLEPEVPGILALPAGMNDRATLDFLKRDKALFTGLIVSIGINDYARLQETSGRPAAEELAKSVSQLVKSLIAAPDGSEAFGCRSSDDEFVLVFTNENGSVAQRRLNGLSERLWDFQLRSLGNFSVMFSWGATEANGETFADAVEAASERMRETRHNRRTISMEKTRLKKVVNG